MTMLLVPALCLAQEPGGRLSLDLYNVPLRQVLDALARSAGLVLEYDGGVRADRRMSIVLKDGTADAALYYALRANSLELAPQPDGHLRVVQGADVDDTATVLVGTPTLMIEVSKDEADVLQQRARLQPVPSPLPPVMVQVAGALLDWKVRPRSRVGSDFTVQFSVRSERPLARVPLTVSFDAQAFEVVRVQAGAGSQIDPQGSVVLEASAREGVTASITFRSVAAAPAAHIQVISARALDAGGKEVAIAVPLRHTMLVQP